MKRPGGEKHSVKTVCARILVVLFCVFSCQLCEEQSQSSHHRVKRRLVFSKSSKLYFRLNAKENVIPWNQVFAHGWGFRVNWELPETVLRRRKFFKRDIHEDIENIPWHWGMQGYSCIMKYICETASQIKASAKCGVLCEIGNIIAESRGIDAEFFQSFTTKCDVYDKKCPYVLSKLSPHLDN